MKTTIDDQRKRFIDKLRFQLDKSGMTQNQFCDACGISRPSLWEYLGGRRWPSIENLISISKGCKVELSYWFVKDAPTRITKDTLVRATAPQTRRIGFDVPSDYDRVPSE